jgi:hypothetical protein
MKALSETPGEGGRNLTCRELTQINSLKRFVFETTFFLDSRVYPTTFVQIRSRYHLFPLYLLVGPQPHPSPFRLFRCHWPYSMPKFPPASSDAPRCALISQTPAMGSGTQSA